MDQTTPPKNFSNDDEAALEQAASDFKKRLIAKKTVSDFLTAKKIHAMDASARLGVAFFESQYRGAELAVMKSRSNKLKK